MEHENSLLKLGDIHYPEPAVTAVDPNLVNTRPYFGKRSPIIGRFAPLQFAQFIACLPPRRFGKFAQIIKR